MTCSPLTIPLPLAAALLTAAPLVAAFPPGGYGPPTVTVPHVIMPGDSYEGGVAVRGAVTISKKSNGRGRGEKRSEKQQQGSSPRDSEMGAVR